MIRFAYLIMTYENTVILRMLLSLIDDEQNDIFIHVDSKTKFTFQKELEQCIKKSKIYFTNKRIDVKWAHISQVEAEYILFEQAYELRQYSYYHLLSGSDLPIKSPSYIRQFFSEHNGKEFIAFANNSLPDRIKFIHLFPEGFRSGNRFENLLRKSFIFLQTIIGYSRLGTKNNWEIKKGTNWASVTDSFVSYLLDNKKFILSTMKYAKSPDEHYKQLLVFNSEFRNSIYSMDDEFTGCMRLIDWERGKPYNWELHDFDEIVNSDKLFARKFIQKNSSLIFKLEKFIRNDC